MKAVKIKENIYWVGAIDFKMRSFHGYLTSRGSSYNAYLIIDEQITLIDGVKAPFTLEMMERIASVVDPSKIQNYICNHVEPDHTGSLPKICEMIPDVKIYTSAPAGVIGLKKYYGDYNYIPVKTGDTLNIGSRKLKFIQTPMIHWPDNMVTYSESDKILFSNDSFGQHYSCYERFDHECNKDEVLYEARKYYCNIVLPYSAQAKKAVESIEKLDIDTIAPSHGVILQKYIPEIIEIYKELYSGNNLNKAVIVYDTMWGSTQKMAYAIADIFLQKGFSVKMFDLQSNHESDVITDFATASYVAVGSSTLNNNILATMGAFLTYLKGLNYGTRKFIAFGSYGWSGQSPKIIYDELIALKYTPVCDPIKMQFSPDIKELKELINSKM